MVYEAFERGGIFDFSMVTEMVTQWVAEVGHPPIDRSPNAVSDLVLLNAAEASLPPIVSRLADGLPIHVGYRAARIALGSTDCLPYGGCTQFDDASRLWDVALFGSDARKLAAHLESETPRQLWERFDEVVDEISEHYRADFERRQRTSSDAEQYLISMALRNPVGSSLGDATRDDVDPAEIPLLAAAWLAHPRVRRLKGLLWRGKLALLLGLEFRLDSRMAEVI